MNGYYSAVVEAFKAKGFEAETRLVAKNNTSVMGFAVKNGVAHWIVYPSKEDIANNNVDGFVKEVVDAFSSNPIDVQKFSNEISSLDKSRIRGRLVRKDWNGALLDMLDGFYKEIAGDMAVYFVYDSGLGTVKITKDIAELNGLTIEDALDIVLSREYSMDDMAALISSMTGESINIGVTNYVLRYKDDVAYGACAILSLAKEDQTDEYYCLPSSVHEWILVKKAGFSTEELSEMVQGVNQEVVSLEERLSDHPYLLSDFRI